MSAGRPCELCLESPISTTRLHTYGVNLCEGCARGLMPEFLERRRMRITTEIRVGDEYTTHTVHAATPSRSRSFSFTKRTLPRKLLELVTRPRRSGDPLFDEHVTASGTPARALARALSSDGFQTAVIEMVNAASFTVVDTTLTWVCKRAAPDEPLVRETRRNAAVVLHHLDKAAGA